jgi:small subunit ribosomal protein S1
VTEENNVMSLADIEPKMKLTGKVKQIQLAGAIIDVGVEECDALLHISQIRRRRVKNVRDVLEEGETVTVWVRDVDKDNQRLDVTLIEPPDVTWNDLEVGQDYKGEVVRIEKFGAFVDIGAERPGLVHVSELAHGYVKTPGDVVKKGEEVEVKVIGVNRQKRQIDLSMKAVTAPPAAAVSEQHEEEEMPTAMAVAFQRAMESSEAEDKALPANKGEKSRSEQDDIIKRALERHEKR